MILMLLTAITEYTCAVMLEPIQGESSVNPANMDYIRQVRKLCNDKDIILIFDEVQWVLKNRKNVRL